MLRKFDEDKIIDMVSSKDGVTEKGLDILNDYNIIRKFVREAINKSVPFTLWMLRSGCSDRLFIN